jgi:hypothetical protein
MRTAAIGRGYRQWRPDTLDRADDFLTFLSEQWERFV